MNAHAVVNALLETDDDWQPDPSELAHTLPPSKRNRLNNTTSYIFVNIDSNRYVNRSLTTTDDITDAVKFNTRDGAEAWASMFPNYHNTWRLAAISWCDPDKI